MARGGLASPDKDDDGQEHARHAWLTQGSYAHRGLHGGDRPENSLAAFRAAVEAGQGIECDVRRSKDGRAIIFHDEELDRLTEQSGDMHERSTGELTQMRLRMGQRESDQTIPTLLDLLRMIGAQKPAKTPLLIELKTQKNRSIVPLCRAVRADLEGYTGPVAVMSYDPRVGVWFRAKSPETLCGFVVREEDARTLVEVIKRWRYVRVVRPDFLACDIRYLPSRFASKHQEKGMPILTWTVRTREHFETARACNAAPIWEGEIPPPQMVSQSESNDGRV